MDSFLCEHNFYFPGIIRQKWNKRWHQASIVPLKKLLDPRAKMLDQLVKCLPLKNNTFGFQTSMQKAKCGGMFCIPSTSTEELGT